ncbi:MAG TPA: hypothetical protein VJ183_08485 [Chloroflexia bacterium]|nr:hypothetical protein [Chloroflexia bacterium]
MSDEGLITGLPTLMAVYGTKLDAESVLEQLRSVRYPVADVSVYHRPRGTDQVIDATTGQVAAGQTLTESEVTARMLEHLETVVLLHPPDDQLRAVHDALAALGAASFLHESDTQCIRRGGVKREA